MADPLWLQAFRAVEGAVGPRVEAFVHGPKFSAAVVLGQKAKSTVSGAVERRTRGAWHLVNLPASSDVRRLRNQIGELDHEIRQLRGTIESEARRRARQTRQPGQGMATPSGDEGGGTRDVHN